jgi:hypothetical protein
VSDPLDEEDVTSRLVRELTEIRQRMKQRASTAKIPIAQPSGSTPPPPPEELAPKPPKVRP